MTEPSKARGWRWYQFGLRTLFLGVTVTAMALVAYRFYIEPYRAQRQTIELMKQLSCRFEASDPTPWQRRLLGADHQNILRADFSDVDDPAKYLAQVARLPSVETLIVGGEKFGDEQLERLAGLTTLQELILDSTSVSPEALDKWRERFPSRRVHQSQRLVVRSLQVSPEPPEIRFVLRASRTANGFVGPQHDEEVVGIHCGVDWLGIVSRSPTLENLKLNGEQISDEGMSRIGILRRLRRLRLPGVHVNDASLAYFRKLQQLEHLDLSGTGVTDEGLVHLAALESLTSVKVNETRLTDRGIECLLALEKLQELELVATGVTDEGARRLAQATRLRRLDLSRTRVTDACWADLARLTTLRSLGLRGTKASSNAIHFLRPLKNLEMLELRETTINGWDLVPLADLEKLMVTYDQSTTITHHGLTLLRRSLDQKQAKPAPYEKT